MNHSTPPAGVGPERPAMLCSAGRVPGSPGRLDRHDNSRLGRASRHARVRYPGPVGELIQREIRAYWDFGYRFDGSGIVPRIIEELLAEHVSRVPPSSSGVAL